MPGVRLRAAVPVLPAPDLASCVAHYRDVLGFQVVFQYPDYAGVARDGVELHFWLCDDPELPRASSCRVHLRGVDALHTALAPKGVVHPRGGLEDKPWGFREFTVLDPWGNAVVFGEPLAATD